MIETLLKDAYLFPKEVRCCIGQEEFPFPRGVTAGSSVLRIWFEFKIAKESKSLVAEFIYAHEVVYTKVYRGTWHIGDLAVISFMIAREGTAHD